MSKKGNAAPAPPPGRLQVGLNWLRTPVDGASLAAFRILFGIILLVDVWRYVGKIEFLWLKPKFQFKYFGFEWVQVWPGDGMYWLFLAMGVASIGITIGLFYRFCCAAFFVLFTYMFLLEQAMYLNHFYLVCLMVFGMCWVPADQVWAVRPRRPTNWPRGTVPRWAPLSLMLLMEIVLIFAGIVKVNADWLQGYPLKLWFPKREHLDLIGPLLAQDWVAIVGSYFAIALHLIGAPALMFRKTRLAAFCIYCAFHISNAVIFTIGIFPFMTIAGTLMFFDPDWPRVLLRKLFRRPLPGPAVLSSPPPGPVPRTEALALAAVALFLLWNVLMPLRPALYPSDVAWTEEGHRFAWRMKLRDKVGIVKFTVRDPQTQQGWNVDPRQMLPKWQARHIATHPDMALQFAHLLRDRWKEKTGIDVQVFAQAYASLNGRPLAPQLDPTVDLARVERNLWPADWIMPLDTNLEPGTREGVNKRRQPPRPTPADQRPLPESMDPKDPGEPDDASDGDD